MSDTIAVGNWWLSPAQNSMLEKIQSVVHEFIDVFSMDLQVQMMLSERDHVAYEKDDYIDSLMPQVMSAVASILNKYMEMFKFPDIQSLQDMVKSQCAFIRKMLETVRI